MNNCCHIDMIYRVYIYLLGYQSKDHSPSKVKASGQNYKFDNALSMAEVDGQNINYLTRNLLIKAKTLQCYPTVFIFTLSSANL